MDNPNKNLFKLSSLIEALLFYSGEEMSFSEIASIFETSIEEVKQAVKELEVCLNDRALVLGVSEDSMYLGTHPQVAPYIEKVKKKKLEGNLGKALLETLTVILYQAPVAKSHIDYIRGVNTSTSIRYLMARGLIEKVKKDGRLFYTPTSEALRHLGITKVEDLPEYEEKREELSLSIENSKDLEEIIVED